VLTGRPFEAGDAGAAAASVIVNRTFVQRLLGGGNPLGRRIRYVGSAGESVAGEVELGRWYEVVGVVQDFPANAMEPGLAPAKLYHAVAPGDIYPVSLALRVRGGDPAAFAPQLRKITAALDPALQLHEVLPLDEVLRQEQGMMRLGAVALGLVTLSVLLLSAAGIYALMSFTVAHRRREIGIRSALGADPRRILQSVFSRAVVQLSVGVLLGGVLAALLDISTGGELMGGHGAVFLPAIAILMVAVGLAAALGPARRTLRIQPTEALRET
jgi:hypothetical protein